MRAPRILLSLTAVAVLSLPARLSAGEPGKADIDAAIRAALKSWKVPGAAVVIVRDDKVIYLKGHGVKEAGGRNPVTPDTLFPLASCTKAFTTTALAILVDEGKLRWDDPVSKHLPYFHLSDPQADAKVTLRDLVTHRTGLGGHDLLWYHAPWSPEEAVRRVAHLPLDFPFRTTFQYQTTMFTAAGLAAGEAAGVPWGKLVQKRIFDPLGMKTAGCSTASFKSRDRAVGHSPGGDGEAVPIPGWYALEKPDPAGSVHASARDLAPWLRFHLAEGALGDKRLVAAKALRETHTAQTVIPLKGETRGLHPDTERMSYAMGWVVQDHRGHKLVSHAGVIDGFRAHLTLVPKEGIGIAILANLHKTRMNLALSDTLIDLLLGLKPRDWNALIAAEVEKGRKASEEALRKKFSRRERGTRPSRGLAAYAGSYEHPAYGTMRVTAEGGRLMWRWNGFASPLEHFHHDTFVALPKQLGPIFLIFVLDESGKVSELSADDPIDITFKRK